MDLYNLNKLVFSIPFNNLQWVIVGFIIGVFTGYLLFRERLRSKKGVMEDIDKRYQMNKEEAEKFRTMVNMLENKTESMNKDMINIRKEKEILHNDKVRIEMKADEYRLSIFGLFLHLKHTESIMNRFHMLSYILLQSKIASDLEKIITRKLDINDSLSPIAYEIFESIKKHDFTLYELSPQTLDDAYEYFEKRYKELDSLDWDIRMENVLDIFGKRIYFEASSTQSKALKLAEKIKKSSKAKEYSSIFEQIGL